MPAVDHHTITHAQVVILLLAAPLALLVVAYALQATGWDLPAGRHVEPVSIAHAHERLGFTGAARERRVGYARAHQIDEANVAALRRGCLACCQQ